MKTKSGTPAERISYLRDELHRHNHLYYVEAAPVISDLEYDRMMKELEGLEKANPHLASPDSPTQRVGGAPVGSLKTVAHKVPMLSIDNAYNVEEVREFDAKVRKELRVPKVRYVVEPKIDGASLSLVYRNGVLETAVTRGDGERGDDVTHNVKTAGGVPLRLRTKNPPAYFEARGEIYITKADFAARNAALKEAGEKEAANPRNLAAGSLRLLDPKEAATRKLRLFAYTTGHVEGLTLKTQTRTLEVLKEFGFHVTPDISFCDDIDAVIACCEKWAERRFELGYDIDGLVIKIDDLSARDRLGTTAKHVKWAIAYKFEAEQGITKLLDIEISVGKYGEHTPVALLAPVQLCGTTVQRASLHNAVQVKEKDIRIGDTVIVVKKGEIIPYVVRPLTELRTGEQKPYEFPKKCVACGAPTRFDEAVDNVPFCTATHTCPHQLRKRLESYAKRERMDIEGLGRETCDVLVASGLVKTVADLYTLTEEKLLGLPRMGKMSAQKLLKGIEASKDRGLGRLLGGLSIPRVGEEMGPTLAEVFPSLDAILAAPPEKLAAVSGFGPIRAASVKAYFGSPEGQKLVAGLRAAGVKLTEDAKVRTSPAILAGQTVVVTGALVKYKRADIEAKLADMGAKVGSSVSKNTDLLIVGADAGSKLDKAKALGVKTISEDEFEAMVNELLAAAPPVVAPAPAPVAAAVAAPAPPPSGGPLAGKTICVTGELMNYKRKDIEALIVQKGGQVASGVTKAVNLVVAGEAAGSKLDKAKALGIQVIDEAAFQKMVK
jgi:DNA ligase (NAD+)